MTKETKYKATNGVYKLEVFECPFCHSGKLWTAHKSRAFSVNCYGCEAAGPKTETQQEAVTKWNGIRVNSKN